MEFSLRHVNSFSLKVQKEKNPIFQRITIDSNNIYKTWMTKQSNVFPFKTQVSYPCFWFTDMWFNNVVPKEAFGWRRDW